MEAKSKIKEYLKDKKDGLKEESVEEVVEEVEAIEESNSL